MKRIAFLLICLLNITLASAQTITVDSLKYEVLTDSTVRLYLVDKNIYYQGYDHPRDNIIIPSYITTTNNKRYKVTEVGGTYGSYSDIFYPHQTGGFAAKISSIIIPETVTKIYDGAFYHASGQTLSAITIKGSPEYLGDRLCQGLSNHNFKLYSLDIYDLGSYLKANSKNTYPLVFEVLYCRGKIAKDVTLNIDTIPANAMPNYNFNKIILGSEIKFIGENALTTDTLEVRDLDAFLNACQSGGSGISYNTLICSGEPVQTKLNHMKAVAESTNVYTEEAYNNYYGLWQSKFDKRKLTYDEAIGLQDPFAVTSYHASPITVDDFLLSAWGNTPENYTDAPCVNTWSIEGESDGSGFKVPFLEYWANNNAALANRTITATMNNVAPGNYKVNVWVRVYTKSGVSAQSATGINLQINNGDLVDVTEGNQIGNSRFQIKEYEAYGTVDDDCVLTIKFIVDNTNVNWLAFKNVTFTSLDESSHQTIGLSSIPNMTYGDGTYILPAKTNKDLPVTWSISNPNVATINGNVLTVKGAGIATITATQAGNDTYAPFMKDFSLRVNRAELTITADAKSKVEGEDIPELTFSYSGFVNDEDATVLITQPVITTTASVDSPPGRYPITISGASANNYNIQYVNSILSVIPINYYEYYEEAERDKWTTTCSYMSFGINNMNINDESGMRPPYMDIWKSSNIGDGTISHETIEGLSPGTYTINIFARALNENSGTIYPSGITFYANDASIVLSDVGTKAINSSNKAYIYGILSVDCTVGNDGKLDLGFTLQDVVGTGLTFKGLEITTKYDYETQITPQALWCASNTTLYFLNSSDIYVAGSTYNGQTITNVWSGTDITNSGKNEPAWNSTIKGSVTNVVFETSFNSVRPTSCAKWFYSCGSISSISGLGNLNTSSVTDMSYMFSGCSSLTSLDVSSFDTSNVTNMLDMFAMCNNVANLNVSNFNTSNVENLQGMFYYCNSLTSIDVSGFNTSNATNMHGVFHNCRNLLNLDVSNFDTSKVTDMGNMFDYCQKLTSLDVSNFNVTKVTNMDYMFSSCYQLRTIYCNNDWSAMTPSNISSLHMFGACNRLQGDAGFAYNTSYRTVDYAHPGENGYFTAIQQTVDKDPQSISLVSIPNMTYGAANYNLPTSTEQGLILTWSTDNQNVATISGNTLTVKGAGTATITASQEGNDTYSSFSKTFEVAIAKAPLTITAENKSKQVGSENPALTVSYSGFVNGENESSLTTQPTVTTTATTDSPVGTYPITASGAASSNYEITYVAGTMTVTEAPVVDEDTDISQIDNVVYITPFEAYGGDEVTLSIKMKNNVGIQTVQFDLYLPDGVEVVKDEDDFELIELSTERTTARKMNQFSVVQTSGGAYRVLINSTGGYTFDGNDGEIATAQIKLADDITPGDYPMIFRDIVLVTTSSEGFETDYVKFTLTVPDYMLGDVNSDRKVNAIDLNAITNYILEHRTFPFTFNTRAGDVNSDTKINAIDLNAVTNMILHQSSPAGIKLRAIEVGTFDE